MNDSNQCVACPAGATSAAANSASGGQTFCTLRCEANERLVNNACASCPAGEIKDASSNSVPGDDTDCEARNNRRGPDPTPNGGDGGPTTRTAMPSGGNRGGGDDGEDAPSGTSVPSPSDGSEDSMPTPVGGGIDLGGNAFDAGSDDGADGSDEGPGSDGGVAVSAYGGKFAANTVMTLYALGLGLLFCVARVVGREMFKKNPSVKYKAAPVSAVSEKQLRNITKTWRLRGARRRFMDREGLDQP